FSRPRTGERFISRFPQLDDTRMSVRRRQRSICSATTSSSPHIRQRRASIPIYKHQSIKPLDSERWCFQRWFVILEYRAPRAAQV
ncbi:unnamed protein product, partial [Phaeothamnion confervicola]